MRGTILIVRPDDDLLWTLREVLEVDGYEVHGATTVEAALRMLRDGVRPDALLLDADSVDAATGAALEAAAGGAPRVVTTWGAAAAVPRGTRILRQPFQLAELRAALEEVVDLPRGAGRPGARGT